MTKHVHLGSISQIPEGEGRTYEVGNVKIAVFHGRGGHTYATQAQCPHRSGPLADGLLGGTTLVCPLHEWAFDLRSGMALNGQCGIRVYPVTQGPDGSLTVDMEDDGAPPPWRVTDYKKF
jgi:nitrite reductase (NADH) small subunit